MTRRDDDGETVLRPHALPSQARPFPAAPRDTTFRHGGDGAHEMSVFHRLLECNVDGPGGEALARLHFEEAEFPGAVAFREVGEFPGDGAAGLACRDGGPFNLSNRQS